MKSAQEVLTSSHSGYGCSLYTTACYCGRKANFMEQFSEPSMPIPGEKLNSLVIGVLFHYLQEELGDVKI